MKSVVVLGTDVRVSQFIFGTAGLLNLGWQGRRERLLAAAADHGFTHFDTAPYYGFGMAERDLATLLRRHPALTVTTKVGLHSPGGDDQTGIAALARKAGGRLLPRLSRPVVDWSLQRAKASLDASLRRLGRDRIDLYMLHEPRRDLLNTDEWQGWLARETEAGRIGAFGVALEVRNLATFSSLREPLCWVVQVNDSLSGQEANIVLDHGRPLQITYGYVSSAKRGGDTVDADDILARALRRNATGAIVVSTSRLDRLAQYSRLSDASHDP